jgi:hypothetical protein
MLERLSDMPPGIDGFQAKGRVSRSDYELCFEPLWEEARRADRRVKLLYRFGPEFEGFTAGGALEDAKVGLRFAPLLEGCAVVTDRPWIREAMETFAFMLPCPVRVFPDIERQQAAAWLCTLPQGPTTAHRLIEETGVIVVEVDTAPLRALDFEALSRTADDWIASHGGLRGLVIHAPGFPGWENLRGLVQHLKFVRSHHRDIQRIALASDGKLASLAPRLADPLLKAEFKTFAYGDMDAAIVWAGQRSADESVPESRGRFKSDHNGAPAEK